MTSLTRWPRPRPDPPQEPAEPWAKPGAPTWQQLLERLVKDAADKKNDPQP